MHITKVTQQFMCFEMTVIASSRDVQMLLQKKNENVFFTPFYEQKFSIISLGSDIILHFTKKIII